MFSPRKPPLRATLADYNKDLTKDEDKNKEIEEGSHQDHLQDIARHRAALGREVTLEKQIEFAEQCVISLKKTITAFQEFRQQEVEIRQDKQKQDDTSVGIYSASNIRTRSPNQNAALGFRIPSFENYKKLPDRYAHLALALAFAKTKQLSKTASMLQSSACAVMVAKQEDKLVIDFVNCAESEVYLLAYRVIAGNVASRGSLRLETKAKLLTRMQKGQEVDVQRYAETCDDGWVYSVVVASEGLIGGYKAEFKEREMQRIWNETYKESQATILSPSSLSFSLNDKAQALAYKKYRTITKPEISIAVIQEGGVVVLNEPELSAKLATSISTVQSPKTVSVAPVPATQDVKIASTDSVLAIQDAKNDSKNPGAFQNDAQETLKLTQQLFDLTLQKISALMISLQNDYLSKPENYKFSLSEIANIRRYFHDLLIDVNFDTNSKNKHQENEFFRILFIYQKDFEARIKKDADVESIKKLEQKFLEEIQAAMVVSDYDKTLRCFRQLQLVKPVDFNKLNLSSQQVGALFGYILNQRLLLNDSDSIGCLFLKWCFTHHINIVKEEIVKQLLQSIDNDTDLSWHHTVVGRVMSLDLHATFNTALAVKLQLLSQPTEKCDLLDKIVLASGHVIHKWIKQKESSNLFENHGLLDIIASVKGMTSAAKLSDLLVKMSKFQREQFFQHIVDDMITKKQSSWCPDTITAVASQWKAEIYTQIVNTISSIHYDDAKKRELLDQALNDRTTTLHKILREKRGIGRYFTCGFFKWCSPEAYGKFDELRRWRQSLIEPAVELAVSSAAPSQPKTP